MGVSSDSWSHTLSLTLLAGIGRLLVPVVVTYQDKKFLPLSTELSSRKLHVLVNINYVCFITVQTPERATVTVAPKTRYIDRQTLISMCLSGVSEVFILLTRPMRRRL